MSSAADLRHEAESRYSAGDLEGALEKYRMLAAHEPLGPNALARMARLCFELGRADEGRRYYQQALQPASGAAQSEDGASAGSLPSEDVLAEALTAAHPGHVLTSWNEVRQAAASLISAGDSPRAFRLVLGFHSCEGTEESAKFLRERFKDAPLAITVAMVQGIGNMVMLTPAVRALKQLFPCGRLEVVGKYPALEVVRGWSLVDTVTELDEFDPVLERDVVLQSMWSGLFWKKFSHALASMGVPAITATFEGRDRHESEFHLDLVRALGFDGDMPEPYCATEEVPLPFKPGRPTALLSDTSNPDPEWQRKRWQHYGELAHRLIRMGHQVGLVGGPLEAGEFDPAQWPPEVVNLLGEYSIPQTAYLIEQADLLVANDSGPAHMGGAVSTDTFVIFGATLESKNLPLGRHVHLIASDIGCRPCQYLLSWDDCGRYGCIEDISVERVLGAIERRDQPAAQSPLPAPVTAMPADDHKVRIDLGCGRFKRRGHVGIDIDSQSGADIVCDVTAGLPLDTSSVDRLAADNLLEHIGDGLVELMNEIWRVCKPGAEVEITVPLFPSDKAMADPTHRRYFTEETFSYFDSNSSIWRLFGASYGIKPFRVLSSSKLAGELEVVLTPDKSTRLPQPVADDAHKPRLCFVSHNQPQAAGAENVMHQVANCLADAGYDVTALYNQQPFIHDRLVAEPADTRYRIGWIQGPDLQAFHRAAAQAVAERAGQFDICLSLWRATCPDLLTACDANGIPAGIWCHNVDYPPERSNSSILRRADFVVAVTPYARFVLRQRFSRTEDVFVIPNAAGEEFFASYRPRTGAQMKRFVYFGRLSEKQKGLLTLCDALSRAKDKQIEFTLDVFGTGPDRDLMKSRVGSLGLGPNVRFLGWQKAGDLADALGDYDLCILPSNFEACSLAVIECMAVGVPLITTAVGGTPQLIAHKKHGLLVPPRKPGLLAGAIQWACEHAEDMNQMAHWAHKKALKRFHWERVLRDYRALFTRIHRAHASQRERLEAG
ncbi:MAG: glycosyltransferase [Planctomycetota bacterium]|jgi:glycosyltransferase involved in cell wall biosynthesis/ADP-heptose:LPS heptosyltransferase